jgi:2-iminoacetate synthase ThiH
LYNRIGIELNKSVGGESMQVSFISEELRPIAEKVIHQERLSFEEGVQLFESNDLVSIGAMANVMRERINGDFT